MWKKVGVVFLEGLARSCGFCRWLREYLAVSIFSGKIWRRYFSPGLCDFGDYIWFFPDDRRNSTWAENGAECSWSISSVK